MCGPGIGIPDKADEQVQWGSKLRFRAQVRLWWPFRAKLQSGPLSGSFQYRPQNTIVLIIGTPKKVPLMLGNPQVKLHGFPGLRRMAMW